MGFNINSAPSLKRWKNRAWGVKGIMNWELMEGNLIGFNNKRSHFVTFIWVEQWSYFDNLCHLMTCLTLSWDCLGVSQWGMRSWNMRHKHGAERISAMGTYRSTNWCKSGCWENNCQGGRLLSLLTAVLNRAAANTALVHQRTRGSPQLKK